MRYSAYCSSAMRHQTHMFTRSWSLVMLACWKKHGCQCWVDIAALYLLLGRPMLPPGEGWALFLLWVCAHIGGFAANKVNLPPLLGMLIAGIILRNIPQGKCCFACTLLRVIAYIVLTCSFLCVEGKDCHRTHLAYAGMRINYYYYLLLASTV